MGKCFINEDIEFDIIYSDNERNIIKVDNRKEIFFEVYESIIDDKKIVLEKIGEFGGLPIVTVEFKQNGKIYTCEALLEDDNKNQLVVNEENLFFLRDEKNLKNNIYIEKTDVETTSGTDVISETKLNIQHTYDEKIKEYENKKFTFLEDIENQFEEKINLLKDDISEKLDTFFEKLDKKKEEIISEKLDEVTSEIDNKFELLKNELQSVEEFSKNNIDSILEKKVTDIDSSVNNFLEDLTKTYKERFKNSDKKSVGNYLNLKSLTEKYYKNKEDTDNKIKDLFNLKNKLLEQDDLIIKNKELLEFINDEFNTINNKFLYITEKENEKYNELLAAVSKKDVVEYKTILKEKIQDVELGLVKEELRDELSENFRNEITSLKKYAEMSSGGGSVAKQFARGGIMEGTLDVTTGEILSAGINITNLLSSAGEADTLQTVTDRGNTTTNSISTNNTIKADTIIATTLLSAGTLDIGFELSGFNVTGSISANGDITGNKVTGVTIGSSSVSACGVSACNIHSTEIFEGGNRVCTTESDTLADVTGRGATTSTNTTFNGKLIVGSDNVCAFNVQNNISPMLRVNTTNNIVSIGTAGVNGCGILQVNGATCTESLISGNLSATNVAFSKGIDFGNRASNDTLIKVRSNSNDITIFEATADSGAVGVCAIYCGSGSGDDNIFAIKTDSNANAFKLDQSGDIGIGTSPTDGNALSINGSLSTNNLLTTNSIKSCSISACNLFVDDTDGKVDLCNNSLCFTNEGRDVRIEHKDCIGTSSANACNLIINASDSASSGTGTAGCLILSAGSSTAPGGGGGDVIVCAGAGSVNGGDIFLNADDTGFASNGHIEMTSNIICLNAPNVRVETDSNFCVGTNGNACTCINDGEIKTQTIRICNEANIANGANIGNTLSAQSFESQTISATNCAGFRVNLLAGTCGGKIGMGHPSATIASGAVSVAIGGGYDASGGGGPLGQVKASGARSVAIGGTGALASGTGSVAMGGSYVFCSRACGNYSLSINNGNAKSNYAIAIGPESLACCNASIAMGGYSAAKSRGKGAIALGGAIYSNTRAYGDYL